MPEFRSFKTAKNLSLIDSFVTLGRLQPVRQGLAAECVGAGQTPRSASSKEGRIPQSSGPVGGTVDRAARGPDAKIKR